MLQNTKRELIHQMTASRPGKSVATRVDRMVGSWWKHRPALVAAAHVRQARYYYSLFCDTPANIKMKLENTQFDSKKN